jgi:hypothetical protein
MSGESQIHSRKYAIICFGARWARGKKRGMTVDRGRQRQRPMVQAAICQRCNCYSLCPKKDGLDLFKFICI